MAMGDLWGVVERECEAKNGSSRSLARWVLHTGLWTSPTSARRELAMVAKDRE